MRTDRAYNEGLDAYLSGKSRRSVTLAQLPGWEAAAARARGWEPTTPHPEKPALPVTYKYYWREFCDRDVWLAEEILTRKTPIRSVYGDLRRHARLLLAVADWQCAEETKGLPIPDAVLAKRLGVSELWVANSRRRGCFYLQDFLPRPLREYYEQRGKLPPEDDDG